ncbi:5'-nucleotidase, lipoprotein e(P4) family [Pseudomonas solani]|uniref:5'-nucleotidase, lipoprotein e(P4) family n=1 Tax=Pseudomonas solani TaxID=2731552 RepID=A0ABM7LHK1_9PSED|nr:HAD family acid phosphatase [Pseudomonas solani]BCD89091.1 5'-nucleotidase, lipoprotein e(P4) family [Pseudomonas solani]
MRIPALPCIALLAALLGGCQQHPPANDQLDAVLWTQTSIEHDLLFRQVYANATRQLDKALADPAWDALAGTPRNLQGLPPALIVDIDETLLDNVPLNARAILADAPYDYAQWYQWVDRAEAPALPGALAFMQAAAQRGITPYYLTNREPGQEQATLANLRRAGFPIDGTAQILTAGTAIGGCADAGSDKTCRRNWVGSQARVLMLVGDSFGDFISAKGSQAEQQQAAAPYLGWLGERWFLLPNPTYGHWYSAPYQGREDLPDAQKRALKHQALKPQY